MVKHSPSIVVSDNPYGLLAITMLEEAFRTIKCYYTKSGTKEEIEEGQKSVRWIRKMEGTFKLVAMASGRSLENFHQMCIWKINQIKQEALDKQKK